MKEKMIKYANVLLKTCLKVEKDQPLLINANVERIDFVRILAQEAYKLGVKDIYYDFVDPYLKHDGLKNLDIEDLKKSSIWNKDIWNEYAKKNAAFLMLTSETPGLMKDLDPKKVNEMTVYAFNTRKVFDDMRDKSQLAWCIAAVPTEAWAKKIFPKVKNPVNKLWNKIFEICQIDKENPEQIWDEIIKQLTKTTEKLNKHSFQYLKYTNSRGTDFTIELPDKHIWASAGELINNKKRVLVNFPTLEIFTSPNKDSATGIVYSSKPLSYQGVIIDDFSIQFENGVAVSCKAKKGQNALKEMINSCENSNRLGEVALVEYSSPISESKIVFYETLYDENASCHLALGDSFPECIENGVNLSREELTERGLNKCVNHVDFMIGTEDLNISGITPDGKEVQIFKNGNFTKDFK